MKSVIKFIVIPSLLIASAAHADTCNVEDVNAEYELVFEDNFDGDSLDRGKWDTEFLWGPGVVINNEQQYYVNNNQFGYDPFKVGGGQLSIEAIKTPFDRSLLYLTSSIYSPTSLEILWRVPEGAVSYEVYRDGVFQAVAQGGSYFEPQVRAGIDYTYEVVALDSSGNAIVTAELTINTADRAPEYPDELFALNLDYQVYAPGVVELTWDTPNRAARYEIELNGRSFRTLNGVGFASLYLPDLEPSQNYTFNVSAYDRCDEFILGQEVSFTPDEQRVPASSGADRLVIEVDKYSKSTAEISWTAVANAASYDIYQDGEFIENTDARSVFMDDLVPDVDRRFRVVVLDSDGNQIDETRRVINTGDNSFALNRQPYLSGIITSYNSFRFKYGRVEMRARMPAGKGLWSAFWLLNAYYKQDQPADPEIDIIEAIGDRTTTANQAYHYMVDLDGDGFFNDRMSVENRSFINDFSADFHTYSADWSEGLLIYYVDGVEVKRIEGDLVSDEQMYIIANLAVGGWFPGPADETTPFPARFEIDYIRVYQR